MVTQERLALPLAQREKELEGHQPKIAVLRMSITSGMKRGSMYVCVRRPFALCMGLDLNNY